MTAFEILTKKHDYIQKNGEKPSEYNEDKIIEAMEEYAQQQVKNCSIPAVIKCEGNECKNLLIDFTKFTNENNNYYKCSNYAEIVKEYLKSINSL